MPALPVIAHSPRSRALRGEARELYDKFLPLLAEHPGLSNRGISNRMTCPYGSTGEPARCARDTLGLSDADGGRAVSINRPVYEAVCKALSVTPVRPAKVPKESDIPVLPAMPVPSVPVAVVKPIVVENAVAAFTPAPAPAPVTAPAPAPVAPAPATPKAPVDENAEFKDLVNLLRQEMAKRNITKLVVTPEGVDATKVITVNESLGF